jgi:hypothetical protein
VWNAGRERAGQLDLPAGRIELEELPLDRLGPDLRHAGVADQHLDRAGLAREPLRGGRVREVGDVRRRARA